MTRARWGKLNAWLITRYDDVSLVLKDERFVKDVHSVQSEQQSTERPWVPSFMLPLETNMLDQDNPNHARLRALVHKAFTLLRVEKMLPHRSHHQPTARYGAGQPFARPHPRLCACRLPLTVIAELLGIPGTTTPAVPSAGQRRYAAAADAAQHAAACCLRSRSLMRYLRQN